MKTWLPVLILTPVWVLSPTVCSAKEPDVRVVFWFDRGRPLDTFKFQAYDLRKKEFTPDVERWLRRVRESHPAYEAYTRDLDLSRERGDSDRLKVGAAITREFLVVGNRYGYSFGGYTGAGPASVAELPRRPAALQPLPGVGSARYEAAVPPSSSPFPVPYPRPHP